MYKPRPASGVAPLSLFTAAGVAGGAAGGRPLVEVAGQHLGAIRIFIYVYIYIYYIYIYYIDIDVEIYIDIHLSTCK
jgi:hypothetical protein